MTVSSAQSLSDLYSVSRGTFCSERVEFAVTGARALELVVLLLCTFKLKECQVHFSCCAYVKSRVRAITIAADASLCVQRVTND